MSPPLELEELLDDELLELDEDELLDEDEVLELEDVLELFDEVELVELDEVVPLDEEELVLVPIPPFVHPCRAIAPAATKIKAKFLISTTLFN